MRLNGSWNSGGHVYGAASGWTSPGLVSTPAPHFEACSERNRRSSVGGLVKNGSVSRFGAGRTGLVVTCQ